MERGFVMRKIKALLGVAALLGCLLATSGTALAGTGSGTISLYHLNGAISGRGVCVQMVPALPGTWACLWKTNSLYHEITELLLQGFLWQKSCTIAWSTSDPHGYLLIEWAECR
jgi:hypothetical protein